MVLFIFFALPVATILLAIVLQKVLKCPILVAITFFAIYLIIAFVSFSDALAEAIVATLIYSILAFVTAVIVMIICNLRDRLNSECSRNGKCSCNNNNNHDNCCCNNDDNSTNDLLNISYNCGNGESNNLLTVRSNCPSGNNNALSEANSSSTNGNDVAITANFVPCPNSNGSRGSVRGCYRRIS